jgi:hypothetical protein
MIMHKLAFLSILFLLFFRSDVEIPLWYWAFNFGGSDSEDCIAIKNDNQGNVLASFYLEEPVTINGTTYTSNGGIDILLICFNPEKEIKWVKQLGGTGWEYCYAINTDNNGNFYFAGAFTSPVFDIGGYILYCDNIWTDMFITRINLDGDVLWARDFGGNDEGDAAYDICYDGESIYLGGGYRSDSIAFDNEIIYNTGSLDIFICKIDNEGDVIFAKSFGGDQNVNFKDMALCNGYIYITGTFLGSSVSFDGSVIYNEGYTDVFVAKLDENAYCLWARSAGGNYWDDGYSLTIDNLDNIYVVGAFSSDDCVFDTISLENTNPDYNDLFIAKYSSEGQILWAKSYGSPYGDENYVVAGNHENNIYVCGTHSGGFVIDTLVLSPYGGGHIIKFAKDTIQWIKSTDRAMSEKMSVNDNGEIVIGGHYIVYTIDFDGITLTNQGETDAFCAALIDTSYQVEIDEFPKFNDGANVLISPNPFTDKVFVKCTSDFDEIKLYSLDGQFLYSSDEKSWGKFIDLSFLKSGVYFIIVKTENGIFSRKIIKN